MERNNINARAKRPQSNRVTEGVRPEERRTSDSRTLDSRISDSRTSDSRTSNRRTKRRVNYFDYSFLFVIIFLLCFGTLMLYSASSYSSLIKFNDSTYYLKKQMIALILGVVALLFFTFADYRAWRKVAFPIFGASVLIVFVVLSPLGVELNGAKRWINLGVTTFQPAELVKLTVILYIAHLICKNYRHLTEVRIIAKILGAALVAAGVVAVVTSNLSSGIIIFGIAVVMLFVASPQYLLYIGVGIGFVALVGVFLGVAMLTGSAFRVARIKVWLDPLSDAAGKGYQILQGLYAIGSGGMFGKGLGQSVQKMGYIPEAQNDYVFTIICEELGLVGALSVILLFIFIIKRMAVISSNAPDLYGTMVVVGVMAQISIQVILNIAVVTNSIPNTGVTLPFISYGGTSLAFLMSEVGLVLSVSKRIKRVR